MLVAIDFLNLHVLENQGGWSPQFTGAVRLSAAGTDHKNAAFLSLKFAYKN